MNPGLKLLFGTDPRSEWTMDRARRPEASEHDAYYAGYIERVPDGDIVRTLAAQAAATEAFLGGVPANAEGHRYRDGAWSVREVVGHLVDAERVFGYRALWFARGAPGALPGMDQETFARSADADGRPLADLAAEYRALRDSHVRFFDALSGDAWERSGVASDCPVTVRALAWILAGHELHHMALFRERYGLG